MPKGYQRTQFQRSDARCRCHLCGHPIKDHTYWHDVYGGWNVRLPDGGEFLCREECR
jgi:hypothetical protein